MPVYGEQSPPRAAAVGGCAASDDDGKDRHKRKLFALLHTEDQPEAARRAVTVGEQCEPYGHREQSERRRNFENADSQR